MRVYYDFQILAAQKYGGISRYFFELYTRMNALGADAHVGCVRSINYYFREQFPMREPARNFFVRKFFAVKNRVNALCEMRNYDIIHPTYYSCYMLWHHPGKLVVTVHDMIHEIFHSKDKATIANKHRMIHAADSIIAISENTKKDLLELYPDIDADKISVIYHGNSMPETQSAGKNPLDRPYVFFVGGRGGYKNFTRFAEAMRPILEMYPELCVFCAGGGLNLKN